MTDLFPGDKPPPLWKRVLLPFWYVGLAATLYARTWWRNTKDS